MKMYFLPINFFVNKNKEKEAKQETLAPIDFDALQKMQSRKNGHKRLIEMLFQDITAQPTSAANTVATANRKVG